MDKSVAVLGAGAVGCYFGVRLAQAGIPVTLVGRKIHVDAINRDGLRLETAQGTSTTRVRATEDLSDVRAGVFLVCVKTPDTERVAGILAPHLSQGVVVISLQNGVDNAERMYRVGVPSLASVVYVAVQMTGPGHVRHTGRGDLILGDPLAEAGLIERREEALGEIERLFLSAKVPCRTAGDLRTELWTKLAMNCAYNAISALARVRYGEIARDPSCREVIERVLTEIAVVGRSSGVTLSAERLLEAAWRLGEAMPEALSSTAQDLMQGKRTEIDSLNGYIANRARELNLPAPANAALYSLVRLAESVSSKQ